MKAEDLHQRLGRSLKELRRAHSMTQEEVAIRAGIGWRHVQKIEAGETNTTVTTIARLAAALGVDPEVLLRNPKA